ncbi:Uncharacterised protein [Kingella potus]|uniref:Uncharacterized protein n=1 Tax=Kingella potus TaxID=265175 RepID=A0A377R4N3_9NEIS|nr:hypothetical protein [Kingella potus]UOP01887.1 hypothetical protein LVJ84_07870 [Kingella potus]STR03229.1 Uncharacterised protein [Kingella potus]
MTRQAFILSDSEFPAGGKPFALLSPNPTREHHYTAQTEQRQYAHNPHVAPQNQNVYRLDTALFSAEKHRQQRAESVNINGNLAAQNLYTLTRAARASEQYNLESWFNRHESGYEDACGILRRCAADGKTGSAAKAPDVLWRILRLKFLGILRNPHNHADPFVRRLHRALQTYLPEAGFEFVRLISRRNPDRIESIMHGFGFSFLDYVNWLAGLYGMLSEGVMQPSLFERMFRAAFADTGAVRIELCRYPQGGECLFSDRSFCVETTQQRVSIGVGIAADMFAVVRIRHSRWRGLKHSFHLSAPPLHGTVYITEGSHARRQAFNRLCVAQAHGAVFGRSPKPEDYL